MNKYWIGIVVSALMTIGCAPKVIETPGGPVECYSKKCINDAQNWAAQHNRQVAKAEREEQKRQEDAEKRAANIKQNPWKTYSFEQVKQVAQENGIKLLSISRDEDGLLMVEGLDLHSVQMGTNPYGRPITTAAYVWQPIRNAALAEGFGGGIRPTYAALCQDGVVVDFSGQSHNVRAYSLALPNQKITDYMPVKIYLILCGIGNPEPTISDRAKQQAATPQPAVHESASSSPVTTPRFNEAEI